MRGYVRVALMGLDTRASKIKQGRGLNITFNRQGSYAALITKTGNNIKQKKIVPLEKVPVSYRRHEFVEMYPPDQAGNPRVSVNINNQQQQQPPMVNPAPIINPAPRQKTFCIQCGAEMPPTAVFCPNCGSSQR